MKFKTVLCALAVAAMAPVFANQTSSNVCGWLKVTSALKQTIVGVPWVEVNGTGDAAVKVAKLVKTDNLTAGDKLYFYQADGNKWMAWNLANGAWEPMTTVGELNFDLAPTAADQGIQRGQALILERSSTETPFFLYGQYSASEVPAQTVTAGTADAPTNTLLASPKAEAYDLNGDGKITGAGATDTIVIPLNGGDSTVYQLKDGVWGYYKLTAKTVGQRKFKSQVWTPAEAIPAGTGFWYVSRGGAATINW